MRSIGTKQAVGLFFSLFVILATAFVLMKTVNADSWSWANGVPVTVSKDDIGANDTWKDDCQAKFNAIKMSVTVQGTESATPPKSDCLLAETKSFKLFSYSHNATQGLAVQFNGDLNAHQIRGVSTNGSFVYMPSRDMLVTVESNNIIKSGRVAIYKNFVSKLTLENTITLDQRFYLLDQTEPDALISDFSTSDKYTAYVKSLQRSLNDKWLVVEFYNSGLFRIDMDTLQMVKFSDQKWDYSYMGPQTEYSVSNDGQHVAVFGENSLSSIFDIVPGCGNSMPTTASASELASPQQVPCPQLLLSEPLRDSANNTYMPNLRFAYQPQFSDDGGEISFYATSYDSSLSQRHVTLRAAGYTGTAPLDYLALGDSFSSGEGDIDPNGQNYYRQFTDVLGNQTAGIPQEKCHISTRSYPYKLASGMNLSISGPKQWDTVACSGATTWDVKSKSQEPLSYKGQWNRLQGYDVNALKAQALNEFIPGRQEQIKFVEKYKPKVITLTIGGNDVDFINKLYPCVTQPSTCDYVNSARGDLASDISNQFDNLKNLYDELYIASGKKTKIYVLSYPDFINGNTSAVCGVNVVGLNSDEREMISNSVTYINNVIKQAARAAGVKYIDVQNSLTGHRICDNGEKYVNAVAASVDINGYHDYGSFHPNAYGHKAMADYVLNSPDLNHTSLIDYTICHDGSVNCPDPAATKDTVEVPPYFQNIAWQNTFYKQLTLFEQVVNGTVDLSIGAYTLAANTAATIMGHSDPVDLGQYTVATDGSLHASFTLPSTMGVGFHRINVTGQSYSGDPIEFEQTILVKGSNPNDIDDDGIPDNRDRCLFIAPSDQDYDADGIDDACDPQIGNPPPTPTPTPTPTPKPSPTVSPSPTPTPTPKHQPKLRAVISTLISLITKLIAIIVRMILKF